MATPTLQGQKTTIPHFQSALVRCPLSVLLLHLLEEEEQDTLDTWETWKVDAAARAGSCRIG